MLNVVVFILVYIARTDAVQLHASSPIGALFNNLTQPSSLQVFKNLALERQSGSSAYHGRYLSSKVLDSYSTALELCDFTEEIKGIAALIDVRPTNGICDAVCLLCNRYNIPHLSVGWETIDKLEKNSFTFAYYPPLEVISKAFTTLIKLLNYDKFTIFYEDDGTFLRLQDVINSWSNIKEPIVFRKLDPNADNREIFKETFKEQHMSYHIMDCDINNVIHYFKEITDVDNSTEYQSFILTNLDAYKLDLSMISDLMANVSTLSLTVENEDKWKDNGMEPSVQLETALTADALIHLEKAIRSMLGNEGKISRADDLKDPPALCYQSTKASYMEYAWPLGNKLQEALTKTTAEGFTGNVEFDEEGRRTNFVLHFYKLNLNSQFTHAGIWSSRTNLIDMEKDVSDRSTALKPNSKLRIATKLGEPYIYQEPDGELTGYAVDLVQNIFELIKKEKQMDFQYELYRVANDEYGRPIDGSRKWTGIIGDLIERKANLAICDLTITSERNAVVDFSVPFMTLGISMLMRERDPEAPKMFSFLEPLSLDVWLYLATTYIIVSFILLICARMSQDDWVNPHPCNQNPENLQNIWSFYNCMWFAMGSIMCQGSDILPRAVGSRWISGMWWFFALIVTSSYTANMSTFISDSRRSNDIKEVKDLAEQNKITYGAVENASTYKFFLSSNDTVYQKLWSVMESAKPTVFTKDNEEGLERVKRSKGNYAFFMESTAIEYYTKRSCELKMVGSKLDSKEYGVAMPKGFPHKGLIDFAILALQESGVLEELKTKWWEIEHNETPCKSESKDEDDSGSLQMKNTSGIFLVLGLGGILGLLVAIIDFLLNAQQISVKEKVAFREALLSEWRASLDPRFLHKAAAPARSAPPSTASPSPQRERSQSRAVSVLRAASSFINFDEIY